MRTTVTIDPDTEALLKEETARTGQSFKEVLNQSIRRGLGRGGVGTILLEPLFSAPFPRQLLGQNMNHLADELDDEETLLELQS
ncbi:MAG: hypothetical protein CFE26_04760 [Verrucomicrobiales bacterium VVV1]|nr:MAG: hypothetical protein CFE26_04760 [Verrucomicrobiales bacterium VVV1]